MLENKNPIFLIIFYLRENIYKVIGMTQMIGYSEQK